jgi:DNA-binding transcriptional LysR family regulator
MIDIRDLEAFLAIVDSGSISKAADDLGLTQPALSLKLKKMETELGVKLFQRTPRNMVPLDTARSLEPKVREVVMKFDGLRDALVSSMQELKGQVRIGCLMGWFQSLLTPSLSRVHAQAPGIRLRLHVGDTEKLVHMLSHGQLEFAIVAQPFENAEGFMTEHLFDEDLVLFGKDLPIQGNETERRNALLARPWVTMSIPDPLVDKYWREQFGGRAFPWERVSIPVTTDHITSLPRVVTSLEGAVAVAPRQIVLKPAEKKHVQIAEAVAHRNGVFLVWRQDGASLQRHLCVKDAILAAARSYERDAATPS